jgi:hypothetical protein
LCDQARDELRAVQPVLDRARIPSATTRSLHTAGIQSFGDLCQRCGAGGLDLTHDRQHVGSELAQELQAKGGKPYTASQRNAHQQRAEAF